MAKALLKERLGLHGKRPEGRKLTLVGPEPVNLPPKPRVDLERRLRPLERRRIAGARGQ
jgi:hypothetical protein